MKSKVKIYILVLFLTIVLTSFASAEIFPLLHNTNYTLLFSADNATSCNFTYIQYADKSISPFLNLAMTKNGQMFNLVVTSGNFSRDGITCLFYSCQDPSATPPFASGNTCVNVNPTGTNLTAVQISIYIFFLLICLFVTWFSFRMTAKNSIQKETDHKEQELYYIKKRNEVKYYLALLKRKLWIVGVFGIYLSLLLAVVIGNQLVYNLGLTELNSLLITASQIMAWGLIPFIIFWIAYILLYFSKTTTSILKYQFGAIGGARK